MRLDNKIIADINGGICPIESFDESWARGTYGGTASGNLNKKNNTVYVEESMIGKFWDESWASYICEGISFPIFCIENRETDHLPYHNKIISF